MTIRDILTSIREHLQKAGIEDFEYESWVLLEWKLHIDRAEFYMNPNGSKAGASGETGRSSFKKRTESSFTISHG